MTDPRYLDVIVDLNVGIFSLLFSTLHRKLVGATAEQGTMLVTETI